MIKIKSYKKYYAVFTVNQNEVQNVVGFKKIKPTMNKVRFKKKTFLLQIEYPSYIKGRKIYYFFNLKDGQLLFNKTSKESIINPEMLDSVLSRSIISQLTSNLNTKWKVELPLMIFCMGFGGMLGFVIAGYV